MDGSKTCVVVALVAAALAACSSAPVSPTSTQPADVTPRTTTAGPSASTAAPTSSQVATVTVPAYLDPANPISRERSVYFDFDDFTLKSEYAGLIRLQGSYLVSRPSLLIKIEGNSDERGSPEYNLALGQRRAEAVVKALEIYGVRPAQLEAVSWGEERPLMAGHDEAAWARNRRADLVYPPR